MPKKVRFTVFSIGLILMLAHGAVATSVLEEAGTIKALPAMKTISLAGFTRARREMTLVSEVSARCQEVRADVGEPIGNDGLFAILDRTFILLELESNEAEQAKTSSRITYLERDANRYRALIQNETVPQSTLDEIEQRLEQAQLQLSSLETQEKILREKFARHVIKGPPAWLVMERFVEPGEWVNVGEKLAKLGDFRTLLVPLAVGPKEYDWLRRNSERLTLTLPDMDDVRTSARLDRISPAFDPETRKINVDLEIESGLPENRGGIRVELQLEIPDPSGAVLVPEDALEKRYEEFWLTRKDNRRVKVVNLGAGPGNTVKVLSREIKPGDWFRLKQ
ncbi:MAG: efflux RND transporter periplasmic adaptor subunit [Deltaproteobacteria bacterium]|nr:MAG: efflux RND transporter periplasmic adaptor subunit [Deltaproteobacteria bacterium]